jgi:hypothetical protein
VYFIFNLLERCTGSSNRSDFSLTTLTALITSLGFPSVGKSTLLSKTTHTGRFWRCMTISFIDVSSLYLASAAAAYEFTTLTVCTVYIHIKCLNSSLGARLYLACLNTLGQEFNSLICRESLRGLVKVFFYIESMIKSHHLLGRGRGRQVVSGEFRDGIV